MKIKTGDQVKMIAGRDKGKIGKVLKISSKLGSVVVDGLNMLKKHRKAKKQGEKGQIVEIPAAVNISNVMLVCPNCDTSARVGYVIEGEEKKRACKKCKTNF